MKSNHKSYTYTKYTVAPFLHIYCHISDCSGCVCLLTEPVRQQAAIAKGQKIQQARQEHVTSMTSLILYLFRSLGSFCCIMYDETGCRMDTTQRITRSIIILCKRKQDILVRIGPQLAHTK